MTPAEPTSPALRADRPAPAAPAAPAVAPRGSPGRRDGDPSCVALIPARAGSKRVPGKNVRPLAGHPLLAYTIAAARSSGVFDAVMVNTDAEDVAAVARHYGAEVPFLRPPQFAGDLSPDIEWLEHMLAELARAGRRWDCFSLLRPTSPFRLPSTIRRAWRLFADQGGRADSLRALEKCAQHPGKMWVIRGPSHAPRALPLMPHGPAAQPWHSTPYQGLPEVWVQNASLEIAWCRVVADGRTIAGETVVPFLTEGSEGLDINKPEDWRRAEELLAAGAAVLPTVEGPAWGAGTAGATGLLGPALQVPAKSEPVHEVSHANAGMRTPLTRPACAVRPLPPSVGEGSSVPHPSGRTICGASAPQPERFVDRHSPETACLTGGEGLDAGSVLPAVADAADELLPRSRHPRLAVVGVDLTGMGLLLHSPGATAGIARGEDFLGPRFSEPDHVREHHREGRLAAAAVQPFGRYRLHVHLGRPGEAELAGADRVLRFGLRVAGGALCVRDLDDLSSWPGECPPEQTIPVADGWYEVWLHTRVPGDGRLLSEHPVVVHLDPATAPPVGTAHPRPPDLFPGMV